jgi:hypothetical protein
MDTKNTKSKRVQQFYLFVPLLIISIVFFLALVIWVECLLRAFALEQKQRTYPSAERASHAPLEIPLAGLAIEKDQRRTGRSLMQTASYGGLR